MAESTSEETSSTRPKTSFTPDYRFSLTTEASISETLSPSSGTTLATIGGSTLISEEEQSTVINAFQGSSKPTTSKAILQFTREESTTLKGLNVQ